MQINLLETDFYYINLEEDKERNDSLVNKLTSLGLSKDRIFRIDAIKAEGIPQDGVFRGCFLSQLKALKEARVKDSPFVILEDDVVVNQFEKSLEIPDDSQCVYLGISSWGFTPASDSNLARLNSLITDNTSLNIARIFNMLSSHSIMYIDMNYVDLLISRLEENFSGNTIESSVEKIGMRYFGGTMLPCDVIMADQQYNNKVYALRDPIFYQDGKHEYCTLIKI
jgi:hypothetical protein